jgi:uncharacterized protein (DUF2141 family)
MKTIRQNGCFIKMMFKKIIAFCFLPALISAVPNEKQQPLEVSFINIRESEAPIYIALSEYSEDFPNSNKALKYFRIDPKGRSTAKISISDLPYGKYAISAFQDLNGNQKMDKGFMGIPSEPFAFSNNYKPMFRAPRWKDCEFVYSSASSQIEINRFIKML